MFEALPTVYDYTDPSSNLALYDESALSGAYLPDFLSENRFLWGADLIPTYLAAYHGYRRSGGGIVSTLLWGLAGYIAPLPAVGLAVYEQTQGQRVF
jgi:hypothetical protein